MVLGYEVPQVRRLIRADGHTTRRVANLCMEPFDFKTVHFFHEYHTISNILHVCSSQDIKTTEAR